MKLKKSNNKDDPITREYYQATIGSIKFADTRIELINILEEFASECRSDITLKLLAYETLDIFIYLQSICRGALYLLDHTSRQRMFINHTTLWSTCLDIVVEREGKGSANRATEARKLQLSRDKASVELVERFKLYAASLNVSKP